MASRFAEKASYSRLPETCPEANGVHGDCERKITDALDELAKENKAIRDTMRLSHIAVCEELDQANDRIDELEAEVARLERELADAKATQEGG